MFSFHRRLGGTESFPHGTPLQHNQLRLALQIFPHVARKWKLAYLILACSEIQM
ncbi:MAG: hypothetical protein IPM82_31340 [Saprospiraceae bacterium]|nr:hypothetical protein [Saprospiraceae bacterium]